MTRLIRNGQNTLQVLPWTLRWASPLASTRGARTYVLYILNTFD